MKLIYFTVMCMVLSLGLIFIASFAYPEYHDTDITYVVLVGSAFFINGVGIGAIIAVPKYSKGEIKQ